MKFLITAFAAGIVLLQFSCKDNTEPSAHALTSYDLSKAEEGSDESADTITMGSGFIPGDNKQSPPKIKNQPPAVQSVWDKKIVKNGVLTLEVKDYKAFEKKLRTHVTAAGGYIASEEQHNNEYKIEEVLVIKVPVEQFDETIQRLAEDGHKIVEKKISSEDVTANLFDTRSRLEAKKNVRQRYMDLLKQANKMSDILVVEKEINGIQEEMEAAAGRINYLSHASAYSRINLTFFQVLDASVASDVKPSFLAEVKSAFSSGAHWFGEVFVALVSIWPLWLAALCTWLLFRRLRPVKMKSV